MVDDETPIRVYEAPAANDWDRSPGTTAMGSTKPAAVYVAPEHLPEHAPEAPSI